MLGGSWDRPTSSAPRALSTPGEHLPQSLAPQGWNYSGRLGDTFNSDHTLALPLAPNLPTCGVYACDWLPAPPELGLFQLQAALVQGTSHSRVGVPPRTTELLKTCTRKSERFIESASFSTPSELLVGVSGPIWNVPLPTLSEVFLDWLLAAAPLTYERPCLSHVPTHVPDPAPSTKYTFATRHAQAGSYLNEFSTAPSPRKIHTACDCEISEDFTAATCRLGAQPSTRARTALYSWSMGERLGGEDFDSRRTSSWALWKLESLTSIPSCSSSAKATGVYAGSTFGERLQDGCSWLLSSNSSVHSCDSHTAVQRAVAPAAAWSVFDARDDDAPQRWKHRDLLYDARSQRDRLTTGHRRPYLRTLCAAGASTCAVGHATPASAHDEECLPTPGKAMRTPPQRSHRAKHRGTRSHGAIPRSVDIAPLRPCALISVFTEYTSGYVPLVLGANILTECILPEERAYHDAKKMVGCFILRHPPDNRTRPYMRTDVPYLASKPPSYARFPARTHTPTTGRPVYWRPECLCTPSACTRGMSALYWRLFLHASRVLPMHEIAQRSLGRGYGWIMLSRMLSPA
ncbi:hypothetical protein B0H14DRAFT_3490629 [Mycena olivaceomarginata]|nr:hypothetical protein B0H14DRAFT_3490629 [Mycena olivaceomarginata]